MGKIASQIFDIRDRLIILGGGSGQIGFSMAEILSDSGARIIIADIDTELAYSKIAKLEKDQSEKILVKKVDVSNRVNIKEFFDEVSHDFGPVYGLINCFHYKGNSRILDTTSNFFSDFENYPEEAWQTVHDVNLKGTFLMSQAAVPAIKKNGGGVILNISSTYGNVSANKSIYGSSGINSPVAYATSKAAIINLTRYMATHLAEFNIRVNVLSPGGVYNNQTPEFVKNYTNLTPLKRMARPDEYQGAVLFLMSEASSYMTGSNLIIDGGWTAW